MPIDLIYDVSVEETLSEWGKCIHAPERMFEIVAGLLFKLATEKPDPSQEIWLKRELVIDFDLQAALFAFATQLLTAELCIEGGDMKLRQKPDNPCVLQQDQGGEWVDVFDYDACMGLLKETVQGIKDTQTDGGIVGSVPTVQSIFDDYKARYVDTSASFNPILTNVDGATQGSICEALGQIVSQAVETSAAYKEEESESLSKAALAVGVGVAILGVLAVLVSGGIAAPGVVAFFSAYYSAGTIALASASLGLTAAGLSVWAQAVKDAAEELFGNPALQQEIVCAWYTGLRGQEDISLSDYTASISGIDLGDVSADGVELWNVLSPLLSQELYYMTFLKAWERSVQFGTAGIDPDCGCEDTPTVSFTPHNLGNPNVCTYKGKVGDADIWEILSSPLYAGPFSNFDLNCSHLCIEIVDASWVGDAPTLANVGDIYISDCTPTVIYSGNDLVAGLNGATCIAMSSSFGYMGDGARHTLRLKVRPC
jgi:hypothetical protein